MKCFSCYRYQQIAKGTYPLGIKKIGQVEKDGYSTNIKKSVSRLMKFERKISGKHKNSKKRKLETEENSDSSKMARMQVKLVNGNDDLEDTNLKPKKRKTSSENPEQEKLNGHRERRSDQGSAKKLKSPQSDKFIATDYESVFKRNSGVWFVLNEENTNNSLSSNGSPVVNKTFESKLEPDFSVSSTQTSTPQCYNKNSPKRKSKDDSNNTHRTPIKSNGNASPEALKLFPGPDWDTPMKEGEVEYFIPSKKYKGNIKTTPGHVVNPFSANKQTSKPNSLKKVNINLKLNKSQDIEEHLEQLESSPGIPYDANRKPDKPLLKPSTVSSPINPFYKRKMKL